MYRGERAAPEIENRIVIIVDDGLATGSSMRAAVRAIRQQNPAKLVVAVPTAPADTCKKLSEIADEVVCAATPDPFFAVGESYIDFSQTTDDEVRDLVERSAKISFGV
jgi:predicted phosphoribosyltransferase